jgi:hypothetical protein
VGELQVHPAFRANQLDSLMYSRRASCITGNVQPPSDAVSPKTSTP